MKTIGLKNLAMWAVLAGVIGCHEASMEQAGLDHYPTEVRPRLQQQPAQPVMPDWEMVLRIKIEVIARNEQVGTVDFRATGPDSPDGIWRIKLRNAHCQPKNRTLTCKYKLEWLGGNPNALRIIGVAEGEDYLGLMGLMFKDAQRKVEYYLLSYGKIVSRKTTGTD